MNAYDDRPWRALYREPEPAASGVAPGTLLDMFQAAVDAAPHAPAVHYFDATASWAQLDAWSDAVAALLIARGFAQGDRLALCLQNGPAFLIGLVAAWKSGGIAALISPMSKPAEFDAAIRDYAPTALLALDYLYEDVAREVLDAGGAQTPIVITVSPLDFQTRDDDRLFAGLDRRRPADTLDLAALVSGPRRRAPVPARPRPGDIAVLAPTSGTTGEPKGAMLTHRNLVVNAHTYREWIGLPDGEPVLAMAPIFHVTGLVGSVFTAMSMRAPVVLTHRFHPAVVLDAISEWRPTFTVAAITAFIALADEPGVSADSLGSLRWLYSGGAPIIPAVADRLEDALGRYIHNVYGQTETASPTHMVPRGVRAPVDRETGVMSVGVPVFGTQVWVVDDAGAPVPPGVIGNVVTAGPQVGPGYWRRPDATAAAMPDGRFHTGDVGFMDADGWFYVIDRSTDLINAAGYKVWPFEVEQVLASHPAVREAAVVGIVDAYRGESTRAYVALRPGAQTSPAELIDYCRQRMSAYKYPREIEIVSALPRTATGKLLRRALR